MDCKWAPWGAWSSCEDSCGDNDSGIRDGKGNQVRTRMIATPAANQGTQCNATDARGTRPCDEVCPGKNITTTTDSTLECVDQSTTGNCDLLDQLAAQGNHDLVLNLCKNGLADNLCQKTCDDLVNIMFCP